MIGLGPFRGQDLVPGVGFRGTFTLVQQGFVPSINNSVGLGVGADFFVPRKGDLAIVLPAVMQWNFWLSTHWAVFGEPGVALGLHRDFIIPTRRRRPLPLLRAHRAHHAPRPPVRLRRRVVPVLAPRPAQPRSACHARRGTTRRRSPCAAPALTSRSSRSSPSRPPWTPASADVPRSFAFSFDQGLLLPGQSRGAYLHVAGTPERAGESLPLVVFLHGLN
ncbi:MAG: hypothetical protein U0235_28470 [Polyangiaceae bacterium]